MPVPFIADNYRDVEVPINWYPAQDQDKGTIMFAAPGLKALVDTGASGKSVRKFREMGDYLYVLAGNRFGRIDRNWNYTFIGSVSNSSGPSYMEMNGYQVAVCDSQHMFVYNANTGVYAQVTDPDFPGASSLTYQDGYGVFINPNTEQFYLTALYDFTSIDALDYASAEGWPDILTAVLMSYRELWLVGPETTEIWQNTGASPFPFERSRGSGFMFHGTNAPATVKRFNNGVIFLNQFNQVIFFQGYQPQMVSTEKMVREIDTYGDLSNTVGFIYAMGGHEFYGMTFPEAKVTWFFDAKTQVWHKRQSLVEELWPTRWLGHTTYYKPWNGKVIVGGRDNGIVYEMSRDYLDDDGTEVIRTLYSQEIRNGGKPLNFGGMRILFNHGTAELGVNPKAMLSWSDDGGRTWGNEIWVEVGKVGEYAKQAQWLRLGQAKEQRIFKLSVSDTANWDILAVEMV